MNWYMSALIDLIDTIDVIEREISCAPFSKRKNPHQLVHVCTNRPDRRNRHDRQAKRHVFQPKTYLDVQTCSALIDLIDVIDMIDKQNALSSNQKHIWTFKDALHKSIDRRNRHDRQEKLARHKQNN